MEFRGVQTRVSPVAIRFWSDIVIAHARAVHVLRCKATSASDRLRPALRNFGPANPAAVAENSLTQKNEFDDGARCACLALLESRRIHCGYMRAAKVMQASVNAGKRRDCETVILASHDRHTPDLKIASRETLEAGDDALYP